MRAGERPRDRVAGGLTPYRGWEATARFPCVKCRRGGATDVNQSRASFHKHPYARAILSVRPCPCNPDCSTMFVVAQRPIPQAEKLGPSDIYCSPRWIIVKPQRDNQLVATQLFDTGGDESLNRTYMAVVLVEAVVLGALWLFSLYFAG